MNLIHIPLPNLTTRKVKDMHKESTSTNGIDIPTLRLGVKRHWGAYKEIATRVGVSVETVRTVLLGETRNDKVLLSASAYLVEKEKSKSVLRRDVNANVEQAQKLARVG